MKRTFNPLKENYLNILMHPTIGSSFAWPFAAFIIPMIDSTTGAIHISDSIVLNIYPNTPLIAYIIVVIIILATHQIASSIKRLNPALHGIAQTLNLLKRIMVSGIVLIYMK